MSDPIPIYKESLKRCYQDSNFLDTFYDEFIGSSEDVAAKFAKTDMARQKKSLGLTLKMMGIASTSDDAVDAYLHHIAEIHSRRDRDIPPYMYTLWLQALLKTVEKTDPDFSEAVKRAWTEVMQTGIDYITARY